VLFANKGICTRAEDNKNGTSASQSSEVLFANKGICTGAEDQKIKRMEGTSGYSGA
jgi:hypothetical protein